jgi:hypothetical protein
MGGRSKKRQKEERQAKGNSVPGAESISTSNSSHRQLLRNKSSGGKEIMMVDGGGGSEESVSNGKGGRKVEKYWRLEK